MIYNNVWKNVVYAGFQARYLYNLGDFPSSDIVGNITAYNIKISSGSGNYGIAPTIEFYTESMRVMNPDNSNASGIAAFPKPIDVTPYDYLKINILSNAGAYPCLAIMNSLSADGVASSVSFYNQKTGVIELDLRNITGSYYIALAGFWGISNIVFDKLWLE